MKTQLLPNRLVPRAPFVWSASLPTLLISFFLAIPAWAQITIERADGTIEVFDAEDSDEAAELQDQDAENSEATESAKEGETGDKAEPNGTSAATEESGKSTEAEGTEAGTSRSGSSTSRSDSSGSSSSSSRSSESKDTDEDEEDEDPDAKYLDNDGEPIVREETKPEADPKELQVRPDQRGKVQFNFRAQPWESVLDWLADISNTSLDWQELPGDHLNLTTQRPYTVDEVRDLINERLLTRGYTLLRQTEGMVVVKVDKLDPGRVPRVHAEDLRYRDPHEFVKVSFTLSWLIAADAVEELKPLMSPHGKLTAMTTSNRLEAMDVVTNLRDLHQMLREEQSPESRATKVHEFYLRHTRAEDIKPQLEALIGKQDSNSSRGGSTTRQLQEIQKMMKQMQQSQQKGGSSSPAVARRQTDPDKVQLVVNSRQNSIIAHAPPDQIAVIAEAVKMFDVPSNSGFNMGGGMSEVKVFRLVQLDPQAIVRILEETGELNPVSQLVADSGNKAIIAYATPSDHQRIQQVISTLDTAGRQFEVIRLRRLKAGYVAASIQFMIGDEESEEERRRRRYYSRNDQEEEDKFRVDADVVNNRLMLWANDEELQSVRTLLDKLGEIPAEGGEMGDRLRTIDLGSADDAGELLDKIREIWPTVSPAPLEIQPAAERPRPQPSIDDATTERPKSRTDNQTTLHSAAQSLEFPVALDGLSEDDPADAEGDPLRQPAAGPQPPRVTQVALAEELPKLEDPQAEQPSESRSETEAEESEPEEDDADKEAPEVVESEEEADEDPLEQLSQEELLRRYFSEMKSNRQEGTAAGATPATSAPLTLKLDASGRLTATSDDPKVLAMLEDLLAEMTPPPKDWEIFELEHATAFWVQSNLEEFFRNQQTSGTSSPWYSGRGAPSTRGNSSEPEMKFIADSDTNTILVQNASAKQLETIKDLIKLYDKPEPIKADRTRINRSYQVQHSKAPVIAEALKDVFRDLLSTNDRSMQAAQPAGQRTYITNIGGLGASSNYKGKLSVGVDEVSNTLILSTEGQELMDLVIETIEELDQAAEPTTAMRVIPISGGTNPEQLHEMLMRMLNEQSSRRGRRSRR